MVKKAVLIAVLSLPLILPSLMSAQTSATELTDYKLLAPLPGVTKPGTDMANAETYLPGLFQLIIAIAGVLAVLRLIYGGFIKLSSDAWTDQNKAKGIIWDAFMGLMLTLGAWILVNTLFIGARNPLDIQLSLDSVNISGPPSRYGTPMTPEEIAADTAIRTRLENAGIQINATPCLQGQGYGCTNLNGLPESAIQGLIVLKADCGCTIMITGGTEPGPHKTHGVGQAIVDVSPNQSLDDWIRNNGATAGGKGGVVTLSNGRKVVFVFERAGQGNSTGDHWHVSF